MFFTIEHKTFLSDSQMQTEALLNAYYIIDKYPLKASELLLDQYIRQQYKMSLKKLCVQLLLNLASYKNNTGDLILLFRDPKYDTLAQLVTYGIGIIPGSKILQIALNN